MRSWGQSARKLASAQPTATARRWPHPSCADPLWREGELERAVQDGGFRFATASGDLSTARGQTATNG